MNDITLQQIEIFFTVAEQLSLSGAAKDLFMNQSAVSRWIQRLETSLNTKLFYRNNRGVELTGYGEFLYKELKPMIEKLRETLQNIRGMYDISGSILQIGCLDSSEVILTLKDAIKDFEKTYPDVLMKIQLYNFKDLREALLCGSLDCIVSYSLGFGQPWNIAAKRFKKLDTYIGVSARKPFADSDVIPTTELHNEVLYLMYIAEMKDAENRAIETCKKIGFFPKEIRYIPSYFALEMAIRNGRGFSICGANLKDRFCADIKLYPVKEPYQEQYVILAWRENSCSALTRQFVDKIKPFEETVKISYEL